MNEHWLEGYHAIVSIMELHPDETIHIICPISYYRNAMDDHVPNLIDVILERGLPDENSTIYQNQLIIKNGTGSCFIRFIPLYKIKEGALRGMDNYFVINLCNCEFEYHDDYLLFP